MESTGRSSGSQEDVVWALPSQSGFPSQSNKSGSVSPSSEEGRRHSSSASGSSTSGNRERSAEVNGRRMRPSVVSVASSLPTVREMHDRRTSSQTSLATPPPPHKFSVSSEETVISSKKVLTNFQKVAARDTEVEENRIRKLSRCNTEYNIRKTVYNRLVDWADSSHTRLRNQLLGFFMESHRWPTLPSKDDLLGLAQHYYPARADLKVQVCDFGLGSAERTEITLGQIEEYWQSKPDWVDVRWIHAPLGLGLTHSSIEDIFLHDGQPRREFENGGAPGWPYVETEVLNMRSHKNFQEMRDVYMILSNLRELDEELDQCTFKNDGNPSLQSDIEWRAGRLGVTANYWDLVDGRPAAHWSQDRSTGSLYSSILSGLAPGTECLSMLPPL
ncbi:MAG: hypothetical protein Q9210_000823 [Variospora velana]